MFYIYFLLVYLLVFVLLNLYIYNKSLFSKYSSTEILKVGKQKGNWGGHSFLTFFPTNLDNWMIRVQIPVGAGNFSL